MVVRKTVRREVRLEPESDRILRRQLAARGLTFAAWVREQLERDESTEDAALARRLRAAEAIVNMNIDLGWDPNDPDPATTLLNEAYEARWDDADPLG